MGGDDCGQLQDCGVPREFYEFRSDMGQRVARLEVKMEQAEKGVNNFRIFKDEGMKFFSESREFQALMLQREQDRIATQERLAEDLKAREIKADRWWKRILTWLLILATLITILEFLGPSIRAMFHIPVASAEPLKSQSILNPQEATSFDTR